MNKKGELQTLFNKYRQRKKDESTRPYVQPCNMGEQRSTHFQENSGTSIVYFFEWSDIHREPKRFLSLEEFIQFMMECGIYLNIYEKELIINWRLAYITCKSGCKDLLIAPNYEKLRDSVIESEKNGRKTNEPYNVQCTRPPIYNH